MLVPAVVPVAREMVQGQLGKMLARRQSQPVSLAWWHGL
jgi:hypothetical protein